MSTRSLNYTDFREEVDYIANQLSAVITSKFDFNVKIRSHDETIDKLAVFINLVIDIARRNSLELEKNNQKLSEAQKNLQQKVEERTYELRLQTQRAVEADNAKSQFLANMSHEMRTPLTAILGYLAFLSEEISFEERDGFISTIQSNSKHLLKLIDGVLDFSSIESGQLQIEHSQFSPRFLLQGIANSFTPELKTKNLSMDLIVASNMPHEIVSDPFRIRQILLNIVSNAVKFTNMGGVTLSADYSRENHMSHIHLSVKDTGIGISEENKNKLFSLFTQIDSSYSRRYGGTGLGLALSQRIARAMQGDLSLTESQLGQGSTFTVRIPVSVPGLGEQNSPTSGEQSHKQFLW